MDDNLIPFQFHEQPVRIIMIDDAPWFVAADIAAILGYNLTPHMVRQLDDDEKGIHNVDTLKGSQQHTIISESGLYNAIFKSRRAEAQAFRRWITADLLPTLRRTGQYRLHGAPTPIVSADIDPPRIMAAVALTNAARRLFGLATARRVWAQCGLPIAPEEATEDGRDDPLAVQLADWARDRSGFSIEEAAGGIGADHPDLPLRLRIGRLLRMMGYRRHTVRRGRRIVNVFIGAEAAA